MPLPPATLPCVAITGASGALGQALLRAWHRRGARLIALRSSTAPLQLRDDAGASIELRQVVWRVGAEQELAQRGKHDKRPEASATAPLEQTDQRHHQGDEHE